MISADRRPAGDSAIALIGLAFASVLLGCKERGGGVPPPSPVPAPPPSWSRDVAPFIARRCGGCHGGDGRPPLAPPALGSYEDARRSAGVALLAVRRRTMPPFGADDTGLCGSWVDAAWLSDSEVATFGAWVEHGAPLGDGPPLPPPAPANAPPRPAGAADAVVSVDAGPSFAPGLGQRATRCFVVEPTRKRATAITGLSVSAEPPGAVRQAALYQVDDKDAGRARRLDAADREPGWACPGEPDIDGARLLASWSRNTPVQRLPAGTGVPLAPTGVLVLRLRYDLIASAPGVPVRARMVLSTGDVAQAARLLPVRAAPFSLAPAQSQARVRAAWTVDRAANLWGLVPDMHTLGRVLDLEWTQAGERRCLAHFGHWDVYAQQLFRSATPIALAPGDQLTLTCEFSTTSRASETKMGEAPDDEQCLAHLYLVDAP